MKNRFFGKYYKFINENGFSFAIIVANSNEGKTIQLITPNKSYSILDVDQINIINDNRIDFNVIQENLTFIGSIKLGVLHPLKKKVMGPFTHIPFMECRHNIYSMYHTLSGNVEYNNVNYSFENGYGYIEGDSGVNFPKKYIWYNSVKPNQAITLAIATIPLWGINFIGVLCFIKTKDKEYYFCTWNRVKIKELLSGHISLKKGKYSLDIKVDEIGGHNLSAPVKGQMTRYIKENIAVPSKYTLFFGDEKILEEDDSLSSCEWMWD